MILQTRLIFLLVFVVVFPLAEIGSFASPQVFAEVRNDNADEDDEDDEDFKNNPWQIDERKLFAAKKFQLATEFAMKVQQIDNLCELDEKQKLKLSFASKGATEQALKKYTKSWKDQIKQFGNNFQAADDDDDDNGKKKKKRKKKTKRFVVKKMEDIDPQVMQMMDQMFFGGVQKQDATDVAIWKRTVKKVLTEDQRKKLNAHIGEMELAKKNARADSFMTQMRLKLALADEQLEAFDKLVRPAFLKKDINVHWQYEYMATLYFGSKHDKKAMKKLLSKDQFLVLQLTVKPAESYAGMFGDNVVVARQVVAAQADFTFGIFDDVLDFMEGFANFVEDSLEGALNWSR